jgi:hypothetical protein
MRCAKYFSLGLCLVANVSSAQSNEKGSAMDIELQASLEPAIWPEREMKDVTIQLTLNNNSKRPVTIYPAFTALSWQVSVASMGMSWDLTFVPSTLGASASGRELRTYYGPPGEPVTDDAIQKAGLVLKPGKEKKITLSALWIPSLLLDPASLSVEVLDPQGLDDLKSIPDLKRSSVLVLNASRSTLKKSMGKDKSILRGYIVVFFTAPGRYALKASYRQDSTMCRIVEKLSAVAKPIDVVVAGK